MDEGLVSRHLYFSYLIELDASFLHVFPMSACKTHDLAHVFLRMTGIYHEQRHISAVPADDFSWFSEQIENADVPACCLGDGVFFPRIIAKRMMREKGIEEEIKDESKLNVLE